MKPIPEHATGPSTDAADLALTPSGTASQPDPHSIVTPAGEAVVGDVGVATSTLGDAPADAAPRTQTGRRRKPPASASSAGSKATAVRPPAATALAPIQFEDVVSGAYDDEPADTPALAPKRVLQPQPTFPKLHKVLAQAGLGSRLEMEQLITEGRITVNNQPAHIGQRIQLGDQVKVNGKPVRVRIEAPPPRVLAYHKPAGEVVTNDDPQNRPTVFRRLPRLHQGKWQSVGRLDLNTEGLLLFTNSGELANRLMHPRFGLEREYAVRVLGALSQEEKQRLLDGVTLDDGLAQFRSIEDGGGEGANCWYRVTIAEGRNREVRRMFEAVGHAVSRLIRIRYGAMVLPRGLKRGAWVELDARDVQALTEAAGVTPTNRVDARDDGPRRGDKARPKRGKGPKAAPQRGNAQPDPLKTSLGYIGADSLDRQRRAPNPGSGRRRR